MIHTSPSMMTAVQAAQDTLPHVIVFETSEARDLYDEFEAFCTERWGSSGLSYTEDGGLAFDDRRVWAQIYRHIHFKHEADAILFKMNFK